MATQIKKWRPRGPILFADRDASFTPAQPKAFGGENCADQVSLALNINYLTHNSKCTALDVEDFRAIKSLAAEVTITLTDYTIANLMAALNASKVAAENSPAAVTGEEFPDALVAGDIVALGDDSPNFNITALSITDSNSGPTSLTSGVNYTLDAANGMVTILDVAGLTQPFVAAYSHANPQILAALKAGQVERWVRFNGFDTANSNKAVNVDMFRVQLSPTAAFDLLPDELGKLELKGSVLADLTRASSDARGQFFSVALAA